MPQLPRPLRQGPPSPEDQGTLLRPRRNSVETEADDLLGRAIQHETDHLDGKLFIDYLGPIAKTTANTKVKEIEAGYRKAQAEGIYPADDEIRRQLDELGNGAVV